MTKGKKRGRAADKKKPRPVGRIVSPSGDATWVIPPPGIDGTWTGSCVVCLRGTDTAFGLDGEPEWVAAALMTLGIPLEEAVPLMNVDWSVPGGVVPGTVWSEILFPDRIEKQFRCCEECVTKSPLGMRVTQLPQVAMHRQELEPQ